MGLDGTPRSRSAAWSWLTAAVLAAGIVTAVDAVLLQVKKSFFTGGFLTDVYTQSAAEAIGFLAMSLAADLAVAGACAGMLLLCLRRIRLGARARFAALVLAGALPLLVADFFIYQLLAYFGDAFDLDLFRELTNGRLSEFLAVAGEHLVLQGPIVLAAATAAVLIVWLVQRWDTSERRPSRPAGRQVLKGAALLVLLAVASVGLRLSSETIDDGLQRKPSGRAIAALLEMVSDVDRDGYGLGGDFRDPAPFDAGIYPFARDLPGDGIDQDGVGGDLPAGLPPYSEPGAAVRFAHRPNVVVILLESFRADAVGRTVNGRQVTPNLDALAARGISAAMAYSHNGYTAQSRFHTLTGSLAGIRPGSLIDDFQANGYEVAYFSAQDESFGGADKEYSVGFDRADVHYDARQDRQRRYSTYTTAGSLAVPAEVVLERMDAFLAERSPERPLFLYLNFHDTHYPYHHEGMAPLVSDVTLSQPEVVPANAERVREMYYNSAANVDRAIGDALARVTRAVGQSPAVVVASDHGESLFDNDFLGHGYALNDEQTRIPLIAAGLPLVVTQPFAQVELRDAIAAALCADPAVPPRLEVDAGKAIFQYLGKIDRPRQIAFTTSQGRMIYDFRTDRVRLPGDSRTEHPGALTGTARERFLALVRLWERMAAARPSNRSDTD